MRHLSKTFACPSLENEEEQTTDIFLSLGSNLGNREENLNKAVEKLAKKAGCIFAHSSIYETKPWGFDSENLFLNIIIGIKTTLSPTELIERCKRIECEMGRPPLPEEEYRDRTIDIDILFYGEEVVDLPLLKIPHPRLHLRPFVLEPMNEIAPDLRHPALKKTMREIREELMGVSNNPKLCVTLRR